MIFIRRFFAIILGLVILILFILFLVLSRVNDTFGNPDFYIDQLQKADARRFDEVVRAAADEDVIKMSSKRGS